MTYCIDTDLLKYRPDILSLGVDSWTVQREEAFSIINRFISSRWYKFTAPEMGCDPSLNLFDSTKIGSESLTSLKRLECFKTLELAYMYLKKDFPEPDGFERNEKAFRQRYNEELESIMAEGIDYDWTGSGTIESEEKAVRYSRRLVRA